MRSVSSQIRLVSSRSLSGIDCSSSCAENARRPAPRETLAGLYRLGRSGVVTPLRDGMNLVAKEFIAAQPADDPEMLILSRSAA